MQDSILKSIKKVLGVGDDDTTFDEDILLHINSSFGVVSQIGVAPGFFIMDENSNWTDIDIPDDQLALLKSWMFLKVRMLFDPPPTSFHISAMNDQLDEFYNRMSYMREAVLVDSEIPVVVPTGPDVDAATGTIVTPVAVWVMQHNLGFNPAGFRFTTLDGLEELEPADIQYITLDRALAVWPDPIAGIWIAS